MAKINKERWYAQNMKTYRAEILGRVPNGLTHNDVYATVLSVMNEKSPETRVIKRRLAGNMISLIVTYRAKDYDSAVQMIRYTSTSVYGFASDVIGPKECK